MVKIQRTNKQNKTTKKKTPSNWDQKIEFLTSLLKLTISTIVRRIMKSLDVDLLQKTHISMGAL